MLALYRDGRPARPGCLPECSPGAAGRTWRRAGHQVAKTAPSDSHRRSRFGSTSAVPACGRRCRPVAPREPPPGVRHFTGRADQLAAPTSLLDRSGAEMPGTVVISAIGGQPEWQDRAGRALGPSGRGEFPDGELYANLRGYDPSGVPVAPAEAIRGFLDALAVPVERIPTGLDAQGGLYRSLGGRRMLIVLDNARDAAQVRPLLPRAAAAWCWSRAERADRPGRRRWAARSRARSPTTRPVTC